MREDDTYILSIYIHTCIIYIVYMYTVYGVYSIKHQHFCRGDDSCHFLVESLSNRVMQVGNYPGFHRMDHGADDTFPKTAKAWKSTMFLY